MKIKIEKLQKLANSIARKSGYGSATEVIFGNCKEPKIIERVTYGYRKITTGEYVPKKYLAHFGWKNTYYQNANTTVMITKEVAEYFGLIE